MSDLDDYMQRIRNQQQISALQGLMGGIGMGLAGYNPNPPIAMPTVVPQEPELNPVLLLGDDDEA